MLKQIFLTIGIALVMTWCCIGIGYYAGLKQSCPDTNKLDRIEQKVDRLIWFFEGD